MCRYMFLYMCMCVCVCSVDLHVSTQVCKCVLHVQMWVCMGSHGSQALDASEPSAGMGVL